MTTTQRNSGFTLIELSVVIVIIGILIAAAMATYSVYAQKQMVMTSRDNVAAAVEAIAAFKAKNGYYPCPAAGTDPRAIATNCASAAPAGTVSVATGTGTQRVRIGVVPLSARDKTGDMVQIAAGDKIVDGYRNRLAYAVIETMAVDAAMFSAAGQGSIVIRDSNAAATAPPINSKASYIVFSHGSDGLGAYNAAGVARAACNASARDGENCDGDAVFADNGLGARSFTGGNANFDDFVGTQATLTSAEGGGINGSAMHVRSGHQNVPQYNFTNKWGKIAYNCARHGSNNPRPEFCKITCEDGVPRKQYNFTWSGFVNDGGNNGGTDIWNIMTNTLWSCTESGAGQKTILVMNGDTVVLDEDLFIPAMGLGWGPDTNPVDCNAPENQGKCALYLQYYNNL